MSSVSCIGVVLAGGANTRFGGALKGFISLGGRRIVDRVCDVLAATTDELLVVANDPAVARALPALTVHTDVLPDRGSLVGLYSGVSRVRDGALVVAWDMPFVPAELLAELRRLGEERNVPVLPEGTRGPEPLCAYYPRRCADVMHRQIAAGVLRLGAFVDALSDRYVLPLARVERFGAPERLFTNVNSPGDLEAAARWANLAPLDLDLPSHSQLR